MSTRWFGGDGDSQNGGHVQMRSKNRKWRPPADHTWMCCLYNGTPNVVVTSTVELEDMGYGFRKYQRLTSFTGREGIQYMIQKEGPCEPCVN
jgi:hypothetical protein